MRHFRISVDGVAYDVTVEELEPDAKSSSLSKKTLASAVAADGGIGSPPVPPKVPSAAPKLQNTSGDVSSPLAGTVVALKVSAGDSVKSGQPLLVLEAMKMESVVAAPLDGRVQNIAVTVGKSVMEGQLLMKITPT